MGWTDEGTVEIKTVFISCHVVTYHGHVERLPAEDPAYRILSCRDSRGRPQASWLRQGVSYLKHMGKTGLASVWAMVRRRPKEYGHKVDAATRCSGLCPPYLTWPCRKLVNSESIGCVWALMIVRQAYSTGPLSWASLELLPGIARLNAALKSVNTMRRNRWRYYLLIQHSTWLVHHR